MTEDQAKSVETIPDAADVERWAKQAGMTLTTFDCMPPGYSWSGNKEDMRRFATLVRAAAMEEAAKVCDARESADPDWDTSYWNQAVGRCAAAIRASIPPSAAPRSA